MSKSKLLKKLVSQTAIYGLSSIVGRLLNYLLVPIYTRVFTATQYGAVTELYSYIGFLMVLYTYGMETAYFRYVKESEHPSETVYSTAFWSLAGSTVLLTTALLLLSPTLSVSLGYANHTNYLVYILLILGFDTLTALPFVKLRYDEHPKRFAFVRIANIVVSIGLNLFFLVACPILSPQTTLISSWYNPSFGIGYIFISNLAASAITLALLLPELKQLKWNIDTPLLKKMLLYGLPLIVVGLAGSINEMLDRVILKYLLPYDSATNMAQLGIYGACYKLSILMTLFTQAFKMGAEPFFFAQAKEKNAPQTYAYITRYFTIVGLFIFLGVMLFGINKVGKGLHFTATLAVATGTFISAFWILSVNSWMQTPTGYVIGANGQFLPGDSWFDIVFNPSFPYRLVHTVIAAYLTTALAVGGVGAGHLLKDRNNPGARNMFSMAMWMAAIVAPIQIFAGDMHGVNTLEHQPAKGMAMGGHYHVLP